MDGSVLRGCDVGSTCCKPFIKSDADCTQCTVTECEANPDCCVSFECFNGSCQRAHRSSGKYPTHEACAHACRKYTSAGLETKTKKTATLTSMRNVYLCDHQCGSIKRAIHAQSRGQSMRNQQRLAMKPALVAHGPDALTVRRSAGCENRCHMKRSSPSMTRVLDPWCSEVQ
jgi:hypothetical protein